MSFIAPAIPIISAVAGVAGAGIGAVGTMQQGAATAANARYQAQIAANNEIIANQNAAYAAAAGQTRAATVSRAGAARLAQIRAAAGASGIDVNTGSAADVQTSERETVKLSALTEENNALLQAYGYRAAATGFGAESELQLQEARQAPIGAMLAAGGGLLGSASSLGFKWGSIGQNPATTSTS